MAFDIGSTHEYAGTPTNSHIPLLSSHRILTRHSERPQCPEEFPRPTTAAVGATSHTHSSDAFRKRTLQIGRTSALQGRHTTLHLHWSKSPLATETQNWEKNEKGLDGLDAQSADARSSASKVGPGAAGLNVASERSAYAAKTQTHQIVWVWVNGMALAADSCKTESSTPQNSFSAQAECRSSPLQLEDPTRAA